MSDTDPTLSKVINPLQGARSLLTNYLITWLLFFYLN
jgi:hypothetical protein